MEYCPTDYTNFCAITTYYKSSKGKDSRNFSVLYNNLFDSHRQDELRVLEFCHAESDGSPEPYGASLRAWGVFLQNSEIIGISTNANSAQFSDDKIKIFECNEVSIERIVELFNEHSELDENFDLIIDSNETSFAKKVIFFHTVLEKLTVNGFHVIEGLSFDELPTIELQMSDWRDRYPNCEYFLERVENPLTNTPDSLIIIIQKLGNNQ
jgi:hypothetical protein